MTQHAEPGAAAPVAQAPAAEAPAQRVIKIDPTDLAGLLGQLLLAQAETAQTHRRLLEIEEKKELAQQAKDAAALAKIEKQRREIQADIKLKLENDAKRIAACRHQDRRGGSQIYPMSNHPDRRLRGVCVGCGMHIEPEHTEVDGNGKITVIPEHPMYKLVLQRDYDLYSEFISSVSY